MKVLFRSADVFDGWTATLRRGSDVLVDDDVIQQVSDPQLPVDGDTLVIGCYRTL